MPEDSLELVATYTDKQPVTDTDGDASIGEKGDAMLIVWIAAGVVAAVIVAATVVVVIKRKKK